MSYGKVRNLTSATFTLSYISVTLTTTVRIIWVSLIPEVMKVFFLDTLLLVMPIEYLINVLFVLKNHFMLFFMILTQECNYLRNLLFKVSLCMFLVKKLLLMNQLKAQKSRLFFRESHHTLGIKTNASYPNDFIIRYPFDKLQTRASLKKQASMAQVSQLEPKQIDESLKDESQINAIKKELKQFEQNQVLILVKKPNNCFVIGTKWVFQNTMDEKGEVIINKARLMG